MKHTWEDDFERHLQDDRFAFAYTEADRKDCKIYYRTLYSKWKRLWRLYYRFMPASLTGI